VATVALLSTTLDGALLVDLYTAYDHLVASQRAANDDLRRAELGNARVSFARLTRRPRTGAVDAGSGKLTHEQLVAFGRLGNFHYFLLSDDPRQALEQAYTCATTFPMLAIKISRRRSSRGATALTSGPSRGGRRPPYAARRCRASGYTASARLRGLRTIVHMALDGIGDAAVHIGGDVSGTPGCPPRRRVPGRDVDFAVAAR
jgi:hypothetical protein